MDTSQREYQRLEDPPVDGTDEPEAEKVPGQINFDPDEIEVATEEDLQRIINEEGKVSEPEIGAFELGAPAPSSGGMAASRSYISDHPTHFDFRADVARAINRVQAKFPSQTFANTYYMHPRSTAGSTSLSAWTSGAVASRTVDTSVTGASR